MESLILVVNELQNVFKKTTGMDAIQLPQIVVVGSQSCGKSSVLESLVGKSFLPRGSGVVTRCPIIMQLTHVDKTVDEELSDGIKEWCSFITNPDTRYSNFDEVREEIEKQTNEMAGSNKGISMEPIIVKVFSPNVINLTLVDLPGVVKVPVGDQPYNIEEQVRNLILKYINNPSAIILAVSPANADIATSESIKMAKDVDPNGNRTLAVITKLDLMDKGTDASKVLSGEVIHVKLGIVGVVNRSQYDIDNNKTIETSVEDEETFLRKTYPQNLGNIGSPYLAKRLQQLLMKHIQDSLPDLIKRIGELTDAYESKRDEMGPKIVDGAKEKFWVMMEVVNEFLLHYKSAIKERPPVSSDDEELFAVEIADVFERFCENLKMQGTLLDGLDEKISSSIRKSVNIERFTSVEDVFKALAKQQILLLEKPSIECAEAVHGIMYRAVKHSLTDKRLDTLNSAICRITRNVLNSQLKEAKRSIKQYMKIQTGVIFSSNEEFLSLLKVSDTDEGDGKGCFKTRDPGTIGSKFASFPLATLIDGRENDQSQYVKKLITSYFSVIRGQVADYVPKHLMFHLYDCTMLQLRSEIKQATAGKENELISEPENILQERKETDEMLENLYQATEIIGGIQTSV